jgi:TP901 family phage tail tape measure protein
MALGVIVVPEEKPFIKALESYTAKFSNLSSGKNTVAIGLDTRNATKALGQISGNVKNFEASLAASNARVIAFGASTAVLGGVIAGFKELANATVEVEKSLTDVNRVFGLTSAGLQKLSTDLFEVSKITASSFKDASQALLEFSRQGVPAIEALQRTKDALTLTRLAGVETGAAVESLTAAVNGFSASGLNTTQILNKLVAVEQNYAVSAGDLSEALSRTGQAAQEAGVDINQLNALVTAAQQNTARGGAVIGNALKTIFTRIQRGSTLDQLEAFNVTVRDTAGNVLPAVEILKNFAAVYKDLGTSQKSQLSEQIAGIYQVNILKALIKDLNSENSVYAGSLEIGANATNEAEVATAKLNSTLSALFSRVGTGSTQLLNNIGKVTFDPLVRSASSVVEQVLDVFNKTLEGDGAGSFFANGLLKGIRNILGGPAAVGAFFALSNIIKTSFSYVAEIAPRLVGITTESSKRRDIEASVLAILQQESVATAILSDSQTNINQKVSSLVGYLTAATAKYEQMVSLSRQLAPLLAEQGISVSSTRGLTSTKTNKSGGHIPDMVRKAEIQGAFDGGYVPGRVVKSPVGGVMNTAEQVKYYAGFSEPFINPPKNSKAGQNHRVESIKKVGVDPYNFDGFVPNFVKIYRAGDVSELGKGVKSFSSWSENIDVAKAYLNNPGFGGNKLRLKKIDVSNVLDADAFSRQGMESFAKKIGYSEKDGSNWFDNGWKYPWEESKSVKQSLTNSKYDAVRYKDDFPEGASSFITLKDHKFDGFIPNFIPTNLLKGYRKVLGKLREGEFSLENLSSKEVLKSFSKSGYKFETGIAGFYDNRDDGIRVNNDQPKYDQAHILAHESAHAFLENAGLSDKLRLPSRRFAAKEPLDVLKNIPGTESAIRNNYPKSLYLEEALVEDSLRSSFSKRVLNKYLGLSEKQIFKSNKLYNRLHAASIDAIYSNKAETSSDGFVPNFAKFLGRGAYGAFYDLEKSVGGARIGKKQFNISKDFNHSFEDDIENEYDISKKLSEIQNINPLFGFPKVFGSRERSVAANRIGKEVVGGITVKNIGASRGIPFNKVNDVVNPFRFLLDKEVRDKAGVVSGDLNSNNLIANQPLAGIFEKILAVGSKKPDAFSKFVSRLSYKKGLAEQVSKSLAAKGGRLSTIDVGLFEKTDNFNGGFVPNFAYKDSVMQLEQGLSGRRAIFDTDPFPHIRNESQPTFGAAIKDHGGLDNALRDSVLGQKSAGLLNKGFVPNFATPPDPFNALELTSLKNRSGVSVQTQELGKALSEYVQSVDLVATGNMQLSPVINKIIGKYELYNEDFKLVRTTAIEYADAQREAALRVAKISQKEQQDTFKIQPISSLSTITPAQELARKTIDISSFGINAPEEDSGKLKQQAKDISNANIAIFKAKEEEIKRRLGAEQAQEVGERIEIQQQIAQRKIAQQETEVTKKVLALEIQKEKIAREEVTARIVSKNKTEEAANQSKLPKIQIANNQNNEVFSRTAFSSFPSSLQGSNSGVVSGGIVNDSVGSLSGQTPVFINENQLNALSSLSRTGIEFGKAGSGSQLNSGTISGAVSDLIGHNINVNYGDGQSIQSQIGGLSGFSGTPLNPIIGNTSDSSKKSFFKRINEKAGNPNVGLTLGIGGPLLSGLLEQAAFGNKSRTELSGTERGVKSALGFGVSAAATGASIGSIVGPIGGISGTVIGGVAGAFLGLVGAVNDTHLSFEELVQKSDDLKAKNQEQKDAASAYINLLRQRSQLTDSDALERSSLDIKDAFNAIKDVKLHEAFEKAGTDINLLTKSLFDFEKEKRAESILQSEVAKAKKFSDVGVDAKTLKKDFQYNTQKNAPIAVGPGFLGDEGSIATQETLTLEGGARTKAKLFQDFPALFENIEKLNIGNTIDLKKAFEEQRSSFTFDGAKIKEIFKKGGVKNEDLKPLEEIFKYLSESKNLIGEEFDRSFYEYVNDYRKELLKREKTNKIVISGQNEFNKFRLALNKSIFDELEAVNQAAKTFEFDKSIQSLLTDKMQEIGDGMFSAILSSASDVGQLSIKQTQIDFSSKIQARQLDESLSKVTGAADFKKRDALAQFDYKLNEITKDIQSLPKNEKGIDIITTLREKAKAGTLNEPATQDLLDKSFDIPYPKYESFNPLLQPQLVTDFSKPIYDVNKAVFPDIRSKSNTGKENENQKQFIDITKAKNDYVDLVSEAERSVKIEQLRIGYVKVLNDISQRTATNQLNLEKKRLSISIAQKDAANKLSLQSGLVGIAKDTSLESEKIKQGGEFRFLGLDRKQEFVAKQADQQRIFQLEQSIEKEKVIAEVNQSILEIAAQNANTEAVDANTLSNLDLIKSNLETKLSSSISAEEKSTFSNLRDSNNQSISNFKNRNNIEQFSFGFNPLSSSEDLRKTAKALRTDAAGKSNPVERVNLEEKAVILEKAAQKMEDSATLFGQKSAQSANDFERSSGFVNNMAIGFSSLSASADDIVNKLGREVPSMFADGIASAISRGITGAQKIGDALRDSAISFGQQIISDLLKANLYKAIGASGIGSLFGQKQQGGIITAQNGMYISGGRTGDRNLALLEDGEYVLNRNAVRAAGGKGALDQFNFNHAPRFGGRFATGGEFGNLAEIKYATPKGKEAGYDFTDSVITGNGTSQKIDDANYSAYAYENDQYFVKKREKAIQDLAEKVQKDFISKQKNAALISTLVGAAGSLTLSAGISQLGKQAALGSQGVQAFEKGALTATTPEAQKALSSFSERQLGRFIADNPQSFSINGPGYGPGLNFLSNQNNGLLGLNKFNGFSSTLSRAGFSGTKGSNFSFFGQGLGEATKIARRGNQEGGVIGLNGGGYLPHGSRLGDTIPALLTGGEYVLNNTAVKNNGLSKLNAMNAGVVEGKNSSTTNTNNNATNISINIDRSGKTVVGAATNSYEKQDLILTKDMARSIHAVVLKTISNEKRYNGELYKNPLRN